MAVPLVFSQRGRLANVVVGVRNQSKGTVVASQVRVADSSLARMVGLLNRSHLEPGEGLWIYPSNAIHTVGMRFAIDVVFLDRGRSPGGEPCSRRSMYRVRRIYHWLAPWRITRFVWGAAGVLELAAGAIEASRTEVGDELEIRRLET